MRLGYFDKGGFTELSIVSLPTLAWIWAHGYRARLIMPDGTHHQGMIYRLEVESGYSEGKRPRHVLVGLHTGNGIREVCVPLASA